MEKSTRSYNEMYKYVNSGNTLYDLLKEYLGETDFSAEGIINALRRDLNLQQNAGNAKFSALVSTYNKDIYGRITESMLKNMTLEEQENLLKKFQAVNPRKYDFSSILQYTSFLENVNFSRSALILDRNDDDTPPILNPEIEELNQILIASAVDKADPQMVAKLRNVLIHMMLIPYVKKQILKENPVRDEIKNPKLHKIDFFNKMFSNENAIQEYDSAVAYAKEQEEIAKKAAQLATDCKLRRLGALSDLTGKNVRELLTKVDSEEGNIVDLITKQPEKPKKDYIPKEGDYYWYFMPTKPKVVLEDSIEYSKDGIENQEIFVASYGDFVCGKKLGKSEFNDIPLELIGVTILGNDENKNYFLLTPMSNISDMLQGRNKEYYKKVLLSSVVLDGVMGKQNRLLPKISLDDNGNASLDYGDEFELLDLNSAEAIKYASVFPGKIGREHSSSTLLELCNSQELFQEQMKTIYELRNGRIRRNQEDRGEY